MDIYFSCHIYFFFLQSPSFIKRPKFFLLSLKELLAYFITSVPFKIDWLAYFWRWLTFIGWFVLNINIISSLNRWQISTSINYNWNIIPQVICEMWNVKNVRHVQNNVTIASNCWICQQFNCKHLLTVSNLDINLFNLKMPEFVCLLFVCFFLSLILNKFFTKSFVFRKLCSSGSWNFLARNNVAPSPPPPPLPKKKKNEGQ